MKEGNRAINGGSYSEVYRGKYDGRDVAIKVLRVTDESNLVVVKKVNPKFKFEFPFSASQTSCSGFRQKYLNGSDSHIQMSSHCWGFQSLLHHTNSPWSPFGCHAATSTITSGLSLRQIGCLW
jgi:hypothetical protein